MFEGTNETSEPFVKVLLHVKDDLETNKPNVRAAYEDEKRKNPSLFLKAELSPPLSLQLPKK